MPKRVPVRTPPPPRRPVKVVGGVRGPAPATMKVWERTPVQCVETAAWYLAEAACMVMPAHDQHARRQDGTTITQVPCDACYARALEAIHDIVVPLQNGRSAVQKGKGRV